MTPGVAYRVVALGLAAEGKRDEQGKRGEPADGSAQQRDSDGRGTKNKRTTIRLQPKTSNHITPHHGKRQLGT